MPINLKQTVIDIHRPHVNHKSKTYKRYTKKKEKKTQLLKTSKPQGRDQEKKQRTIKTTKTINKWQ